jgi:hypothetical protein
MWINVTVWKRKVGLKAMCRCRVLYYAFPFNKLVLRIGVGYIKETTYILGANNIVNLYNTETRFLWLILYYFCILQESILFCSMLQHNLHRTIPIKSFNLEYTDFVYC